MARQKNPINRRRDEIRTWLDNCDPKTTQARDNIKRAVKLIWQRQTFAEQKLEATTDHNCIGFGAFDVKFAARIVNWDGMITYKMAKPACKMIRKYAKQLAAIALNKEAR